MGDIRWPDGKKCAVMFTFDVDGDTTWENGNRGLKNGEKYIKSLNIFCVFSIISICSSVVFPANLSCA